MIKLRKPTLTKRRFSLFGCTLLCAAFFVALSCRLGSDEDSYLSSLSLVPLKTEYQIGDSLNPITDLRVYAVTSSGTVKEVPIEYYTIDPSMFKTSGKVVVNVNYEGLVGTYTVTVMGDGSGDGDGTYIIININW
ncbi:MAG: hypothetical protein Ta2B_03820 [Termitinemataceae bacterium]|nr:MAG: hypothetical protein Ta2B_03820 [Termitinemataceae bacterium]